MMKKRRRVAACRRLPQSTQRTRRNKRKESFCVSLELAQAIEWQFPGNYTKLPFPVQFEQKFQRGLPGVRRAQC